MEGLLAIVFVFLVIRLLKSAVNTIIKIMSVIMFITFVISFINRFF